MVLFLLEIHFLFHSKCVRARLYVYIVSNSTLFPKSAGYQIPLVFTQPTKEITNRYVLLTSFPVVTVSFGVSLLGPKLLFSMYSFSLYVVRIYSHYYNSCAYNYEGSKLATIR